MKRMSKGRQTKKKMRGMKKKIICSICEKELEECDLKSNGQSDRINGAVIGKYIEISGHSTCINNVDHKVVIPNRLRIEVFISKITEELRQKFQEE